MKKLSLLVSALALTTAATFADSGSYGTISWTIENETLTISGTGAIGYHNAWDGRNDFKHVVIKDGITELGEGSFYHCGSNILTYDIPASVTTIDEWALINNNNVQKITVHWTGNAMPYITSTHMGIYGDVFHIELSVPRGTYGDYYVRPGWRDFDIQTRPADAGIGDVSVTKTAVGYLDLLGKPLPQAPDSGAYIILYDDGSAEKAVR